MTRPILKADEDVYTEPNITKLKAFPWKLNVPYKILSPCMAVNHRHLAVTRNLNRRYMRCDNIFPKCGDHDESIIHAIFECPPPLWALTATFYHLNIFPTPIIYTNMDYYYFCRKNSIVDLEMVRDPYPWIISYL